MCVHQPLLTGTGPLNPCSSLPMAGSGLAVPSFHSAPEFQRACMMLPGCLLPCQSSFVKRYLLSESLFRVYIHVYSTVYLSDLVDSCCCAFYHLHWCLPSSFSPGKQKQNKTSKQNTFPKQSSTQMLTFEIPLADTVVKTESKRRH